MNFSEIAVGGFFILDGEKCKKTGFTTYVSTENPALGEYTIQPITEGKIKPFKGPSATPALVPVKFADLKVGDSFTIQGQAFKKTGVKTYKSTDGRWAGEQTINPLVEKTIRVKPAAAPKVIVKTPAPKKAVKKPVVTKVVLKKKPVAKKPSIVRKPVKKAAKK
jgi:hypothetical protein